MEQKPPRNMMPPDPQLPAVSVARALLLRLALVAVSGCLPSFSLPEDSRESSAVCGGEGQACCAAGEAACGSGLDCQRDAGRCQRERRYCVADVQCGAGQTCCLSGLLGSCVSLDPGAECPLADLQIAATSDTLDPWLEARVFDPVASAADACALEKGCVRGAGRRQLLHFTTVISNAGDADLLLGAPSTPPFALAACDGQPYLPNFASYQLVDVNGALVAEGHMQAQCQAAPRPFLATFDCEFYGLPSAFSQVFRSRLAEPADELGAASATQDPCQWLDITDVAPGSYVLRLQVNPDNLLVEKRTNNNRLDLPIQIPAFEDPSQSCPAQDDYALLGQQLRRECGWVPSSAPITCTPGQYTTVVCSDCSGDPMLRVCDGASPCLADLALASGDSSLTECVGSCGTVNQCPKVSFECPRGGAYSVYVAAADSAPARCSTTVSSSTMAGANARP